MERREALRMLAAGTVLQLRPGGLLTVLRDARRLLDTKGSARTLNAHQFATVRAMAELILPRTETPGATDVGVGDFVDLMLTEWFDERDRARFLTGLADVDVRTTALFGENFIAASPDQQAKILVELGEKITGNAGRMRDLPPDSTSRTDVTYYSMLRQLTLTAYYTSEMGETQALHFEIIPDSHDGCAPRPSAKGPENQ